jgi:tRNA threonylcarbamoyladenosine biosynthesis protein TsaB
MKNGNRDFKELQAVSISIGPGSYTGLRIGLSTVKGLVFALKCPIIALDTLEILAKSHANKGNIISMIDARRMEVYAFGIDGSKKSIFSSKPVILEAQTFSVFEPFLCIGDGALKTKEIWSGRAINYDDDFRLDASLQCKISYEKYLKKEFSSPEHLVPNYLKDFQLNKS